MNFEREPQEFAAENQEMESPSFWARAMNQIDRYRQIVKDEKVREAAKAAARTAINIGITIADFVPAVGDAASWAADALKFSKYDLTPNVSKTIAIGSEAIEAMTGGVAPSHAVEGLLQLRHDVPKMREGFAQLKGLWSSEQEDYAGSQGEIGDAMSTFEVEPPVINK
jgi:hypothetical protein